MAYEALKASDKTVKNILFLTDGEPFDGEELKRSGLLESMYNANITVTSIAVGSYLNTDILDHIAEKTEGSVVKVAEAKDIPEIMYTEVYKAALSTYINNVTFYPVTEDYNSVLSGISGLPELDGYVSTKIKPLAFNVLVSETEEPVLAMWQYGLGRTCVFTSDLNGRWSSKFLASENGRKLILNMFSYILPTEKTGETGTVDLTRKGDKGVISAVSPVTDKTYKAVATVISPSGAETTLELVQSGIGTYSGEFLLEEEGGYVVTVSQQDDEGNTVMDCENAMAVRYSDEYNVFIKNNGTVETLCKDTGGRGDWHNIDDILAVKMKDTKASRQFTLPFILAVTILVLLDIALRRLDLAAIFKRKEKEKSKDKNKDKLPEKVSAEATEKKEPKEAKEKKTDNRSADNKKNKEKDKNKEKKEPTQDPAGGISDLLKEKEDMKRKHIK